MCAEIGTFSFQLTHSLSGINAGSNREMWAIFPVSALGQPMGDGWNGNMLSLTYHYLSEAPGPPADVWCYPKRLTQAGSQGSLHHPLRK